jgi:hypothetical protein
MAGLMLVLRELEVELQCALERQDTTTQHHDTALTRACHANFEAGMKLLLKACAQRRRAGFWGLHAAVHCISWLLFSGTIAAEERRHCGSPE